MKFVVPNDGRDEVPEATTLEIPNFEIQLHA